MHTEKVVANPHANVQAELQTRSPLLRSVGRA